MQDKIKYVLLYNINILSKVSFLGAWSRFVLNVISVIGRDHSDGCKKICTEPHSVI